MGSTALGITGIREGAEVLEDILDRSGTTINADNGATVNGAIGEGNTFNSEEVVAPFGGVPLAEAPVEPVALGTTQADEEEDPLPETEGGVLQVVDVFTCLEAGGDPVDTENNAVGIGNPDLFDRCSDGSGGTITSVPL